MWKLIAVKSSDSRLLPSTLEHFATRGADVADVTAEIVGVWTNMRAALVPVIGQRGIAALYERTLHLTRASHPWLAAVPEGVEPNMDLSALKAVLLQQSSAAAAAGGGAHLQAFHELLGSLIGLGLTERMLSSIWSGSFPGSTDKEGSK
jgi:hypothetical protein